MRTWLMVVGGLSVWTAVANAQERTRAAHLCGHAKVAASRLAGPAGDVPAPRLERSADTDVLHYWLDIELNPSTHSVSGSNTMSVRSQTDNLTTFVFRLHSDYLIDELRVGGVPVPWTRLDTANVEVTLDRPYNVGEVFELYVQYGGQPPTFQGRSALTFRTRNGAAEAYTFSEPWFAFGWWPAKDDLTDKTTADLWFTVPAGMVVGSNGLLQGVDNLAGDRLRYRWRSTYPAADYLYSLVATNFHVFGGTWTYGDYSMPLQFFIYPEDDTPQNQQGWLDIGVALTTFSDMFGVYPFVNEKYGMGEWPVGGAMEHQTLTSIFGFFSLNWIVVHELAHQWWGDNVTCATWHDTWLNEGFATYCEALWYENMPGSPGEPWLHMYMSYIRPSNQAGTVYCYDITDPYAMFSEAAYLKGAWVLHMLRHVVGDADFYAILAAYRAAYQGSSATTDDFRAVCESVTGRDLFWFFAQWVYSDVIPNYNYGWRQLVLDERRYVELMIQHDEWPTTIMPIDIQITQGANSTTYVVWNDSGYEHFLIPVNSDSVASLAFDPTPWILCSVSQNDFVDGPPKIVTMSPDPNATLPAAEVAALEVVFQEPVLAQASDFTLVGTRGGPVAFDYAYNPDRHAVTLTPAAPLATDTYTLTVTDTIVEPTYSQPLDGELVKPDSPNPLPSGDGVAGGSAVAQFFLTRAGDLNCNGVVNFDDIDPFVLALSDPAGYGAQFTGCPLANADANADGNVNFDDISPFVAILSGT
jgi:methionine-rich copper-binding protein CopC